MDVKTVCLGMLSDGPASGYDLKKQFESSFGHFFAAGYGSIYPALSALAADGLVTCEEIPQEGKPDRKVYAITDSGLTFLLTALEKPSPSHKIRSEFLATMCFAHLMSREQLETVFGNRLREIDELVAAIDQARSECGNEWPPGLQFVAGLGEAVNMTMKKFIEENGQQLVRHAFAAESPKRRMQN